MATLGKENDQTARTLIKKADQLSHRKDRTFYFNAAILTVYGWQIAIPVVLGIFLGRFLDKSYPSQHVSWTLNLIIIGFLVGIFNANHWINREGIIKKGHKK